MFSLVLVTKKMFRSISPRFHHSQRLNLFYNTTFDLEIPDILDFHYFKAFLFTNGTLDNYLGSDFNISYAKEGLIKNAHCAFFLSRQNRVLKILLYYFLQGP